MTNNIELLIKVLAKLDPINTGCNYSTNVDSSDEYFVFADYALELVLDPTHDIYSAIELSFNEIALYKDKLTIKQREYINDNFLKLLN